MLDYGMRNETKYALRDMNSCQEEPYNVARNLF